MRESLSAMLTFKGFLSTVDSLVLLEVMFEFERLSAFVAFEPAQHV